MAQALVGFRLWLRLSSIFTMLSFRQCLHQTGRFFAAVSGLTRCWVGRPQTGQIMRLSSVIILSHICLIRNFFPHFLLAFLLVTPCFQTE